ncbi:MAG: hypothetical protein FJ137_19645 [Deltaproteobacteria bacterium]|nr:hypothetical protein [Deltaproteobacteria bacterium]
MDGTQSMPAAPGGHAGGGGGAGGAGGGGGGGGDGGGDVAATGPASTVRSRGPGSALAQPALPATMTPTTKVTSKVGSVTTRVGRRAKTDETGMRSTGSSCVGASSTTTRAKTSAH